VRSALTIAVGYSGILAVLFFVAPDLFLELFRQRIEEGPGFQAILDKGSILLRLVALFTLFDTVFIVYSGALKGAGDTTFAMWAQILAAWIVFVPAVYVIIEYLNVGLFIAWAWCLVYVMGLSTAFWVRFRCGQWKGIRMLEQA
jgi:MATE family multidrug resistance protein